ncbi:MAG: BF3164 family lipoprotein [Cyclobacteriaceae bacterium]
MLFFLSFCGEPASTSKNVKSFSKESIPESIALLGKKYYFDQLKMPLNLIIKDRYLIVGESRRIPSEFSPVHVIDHRTMEYKMAKGMIGFGPGEISDAWILDPGSEEETFWVYSAMEKRFSEFNLNDTLALSHNQIKQSGDFFMAVLMTWASDSTVMCRLANDEHQFVEFHIDGTRVREFGLWKDMLVRKDLNDFMMAQLHKGWFKGDLRNNIFVSAGIYRDRLDILNKSSGEILTINGPENKIPEFKIVSGQGQSPGLIVDINEPYAYKDIYIGDKFLYGLYCGRTVKQMREGNETATEIYVFDKQGNIQYEFKLDQSISSLAVDEISRKLFGISTDEDPGIIMFDMPI